MMLKRDAEQAIIRERLARPEAERQTESHAPVFAMKVKDKFPFRTSGDRYQAVKAIILRYQTLIAASLKWPLRP